MAAAYRSAGIERYAAWVHESDEGMRAELSGRGYTIAESTLAMGTSLDATSLTQSASAIWAGSSNRCRSRQPGEGNDVTPARVAGLWRHDRTLQGL